MERLNLTLNLSGKVRRVVENGVSYLVAPATMLKQGVLAGSKGPLFYEQREIDKAAQDWNRMPILHGHPYDAQGTPIAAGNHPEVVKAKGLGSVRNVSSNGKLRSELWFDEVKTKTVSPTLHKKLENGEPVELSTGLHTDNEDAPPGANYNGTPFVAYARNHRPDHLAILENERGACSIADGCGVLVNSKTNAGKNDHIAALKSLIANANPEGCNQYKKCGEAGVRSHVEHLDRMLAEHDKASSAAKKSGDSKTWKKHRDAGEKLTGRMDAAISSLPKHLSKKFNDEYSRRISQRAASLGLNQASDSHIAFLTNTLVNQPRSLNTGYYKRMNAGTGKGDVHESAQRGSIQLSESDKALGASAKRQHDSGLTVNPAWVDDEAAWDKAKAAADKGSYGADSYWPVVAHIYQNITGSEGYKGPRQSAKKYADTVGYRAKIQQAKETTDNEGDSGGEQSGPSRVKSGASVEADSALLEHAKNQTQNSNPEGHNQYTTGAVGGKHAVVALRKGHVTIHLHDTADEAGVTHSRLRTDSDVKNIGRAKLPAKMTEAELRKATLAQYGKRGVKPENIHLVQGGMAGGQVPGTNNQRYAMSTLQERVEKALSHRNGNGQTNNAWHPDAGKAAAEARQATSAARQSMRSERGANYGELVGQRPGNFPAMGNQDWDSSNPEDKKAAMEYSAKSQSASSKALKVSGEEGDEAAMNAHRDAARAHEEAATAHDLCGNTEVAAAHDKAMAAHYAAAASHESRVDNAKKKPGRGQSQDDDWDDEDDDDFDDLEDNEEIEDNALECHGEKCPCSNCVSNRKQSTTTNKETEMPKATSSMADVSGDDAKNAEATKKAYAATKAALDGTAQTKQPNATPDSHEAAAEAHEEAASAHKELADGAEGAEKDLHEGMAGHHEAQAKLHREAMGGAGDSLPTGNALSMKKRQKIINKLIANCGECGFGEADRPMLNSLSDDTLRKQNERRKTLTANAKTGDKGPVALDEYLKTAPPELKAIVDNHRLAEHNEKVSIVNQLVANVGERDRKAQVQRLMGKDLTELRQDLSLLPRTHAPLTVTMPNYLGAAAPAMAFNQAPVVNEDEDMDMIPEQIDYSEIARDHKRFGDFSAVVRE